MCLHAKVLLEFIELYTEEMNYDLVKIWKLDSSVISEDLLKVLLSFNMHFAVGCCGFS